MSPYEYRKLTPEQRDELVRERMALGYPSHSPPHPVRDQEHYLLSAACYDHARHMLAEKRRQHLLDMLFELLILAGIELRAWIVLPNHYHLLVQVADFAEIGRCLGIAHRTSSRQWNCEDGTPGRQVWYGYTDRAIRSERHYFVTLNYIHYNPVKHRWTPSPYDWRQSSVHWYLAQHGREWLRDLWARYPLRSYGHGWDDGLDLQPGP